MNKTLLNKNIICDFSTVKEVSSEIRSVIQVEVLDETWVAQFELAIVEAINNIVEHSYADSNEGYLAVKVSVTPKGIEVVLSDKGKTMDVLGSLRELPNPEDLPEGGWGMFIIESYVDDIDYKTTRGVNYLSLVKHNNK